MTPQIRITENIEGKTFEDSTFIKYTITHEGKEVQCDSKDMYINMIETMIEIQLHEDGEFLKEYTCEYAHDNGSQPHVFIDGVATGFNELDRYIDFRKIVMDYVFSNMESLKKGYSDSDMI